MKAAYSWATKTNATSVWKCYARWAAPIFTFGSDENRGRIGLFVTPVTSHRKWLRYYSVGWFERLSPSPRPTRRLKR
jgi:hypothetical protein